MFLLLLKRENTLVLIYQPHSRNIYLEVSTFTKEIAYRKYFYKTPGQNGGL